MALSTRLGGFKILEGMARFSLTLQTEPKNPPARFCSLIAQKEINLPYFTCINNGDTWGINTMVDADHGLNLSLLIDENFGRVFDHASESAILSIFPHRRDPGIMGILLETFGKTGIEPDALASSPSTISVVLDEKYLDRIGDALFGPFSFGAYRTPHDWKLTQEGKEQLYKEVVASYQEQKPKVYGLEYQDGQEIIRIRLDSHGIGGFGSPFKEFGQQGLNLSFSATGPRKGEGKGVLAFCLPASEKRSHSEVIDSMVEGKETDSISPVGVFSMNGPHFGDRYGIVSELLMAFEDNGIELLGLSCTIASITGVVPSTQLDPAIRAVQNCFEVPNVIKKEG